MEEFKTPTGCDMLRWVVWFETDILAQIRSMLHDDIAFQTLEFIFKNNKETILHNPMVWRGLSQGYAATQYLCIRRLTDKGLDGSGRAKNPEKQAHREVVSLWRLLKDIERTDQECEFLSGLEEKVDPDENSELKAIKHYVDKCVAHTADRNTNSEIDVPTKQAIVKAQRNIVFVAQAISYCYLGNRGQLDVVPRRPDAFSNLESIALSSEEKSTFENISSNLKAFSDPEEFSNFESKTRTVLSGARNLWGELRRERNCEWTARALEETRGLLMKAT